MVTPPPSELTEGVWFRSYSDALWFLYNWLLWQGKRRTSFTVSYDKGREWYLWMHVDLTLPHQTNNVARECVVEELTIDKNRNSVTVRVVVLEEIGMGTAYQDTNVAQSTKYQDTNAVQTTIYQDIAGI